MLKSRDIKKNELGNFIVKNLSGEQYFLANIESEEIGAIVLMFPYNSNGISEYQINCFRKIENEWGKLKKEVAQNLKQEYKFKKLKLDSITINEEIRPDSAYDVSLVYRYKRIFSTVVICFTLLVREWEIDEVMYL